MYRWLCKRRTSKENITETHPGLEEERQIGVPQESSRRFEPLRSFSTPNIISNAENERKQIKLRKCNTICSPTEIQQETPLFNEDNYINYQHHLEIAHARNIAKSEKIEMTAYVQNVPHADINHSLENAVISIRFFETPEAYYYTVSEGIRALRVFSMVKIVDEGEKEDDDNPGVLRTDTKELESLTNKGSEIVNFAQKDQYSFKSPDMVMAETRNHSQNFNITFKSSSSEELIGKRNSDVVVSCADTDVTNGVQPNVEEDLFIVDLDEISGSAFEQGDSTIISEHYDTKLKDVINRNSDISMSTLNFRARKNRTRKSLNFCKNSSRFQPINSSKRNLANEDIGANKQITTLKRRSRKFLKRWKINMKLGHEKEGKRKAKKEFNSSTKHKGTRFTISQGDNEIELNCKNSHYISKSSHNHHKQLIPYEEVKAQGDYADNKTLTTWPCPKFVNVLNSLKRCVKFFTSVKFSEYTSKPNYKVIFVTPIPDDHNQSKCCTGSELPSGSTTDDNKQRCSLRKFTRAVSCKMIKSKRNKNRIKNRTVFKM